MNFTLVIQVSKIKIDFRGQIITPYKRTVLQSTKVYSLILPY